jgi:hypothetical protein
LSLRCDDNQRLNQCSNEKAFHTCIYSLDDLKKKKIITYPNSGYRGNIAADELNKQGFDTVIMEGGYSAWKEYGNKKIVIMSEVWNIVYNSDSTFFGEEPSNFAHDISTPSVPINDIN